MLSFAISVDSNFWSSIEKSRVVKSSGAAASNIAFSSVSNLSGCFTGFLVITHHLIFDLRYYKVPSFSPKYAPEIESTKKTNEKSLIGNKLSEPCLEAFKIFHNKGLGKIDSFSGNFFCNIQGFQDVPIRVEIVHFNIFGF